ncbi:ASPM-SPD-2-Hydin domain-containing protein [Phytophthora infestans]|uniref:ASPM-SPD-2-Hydin domain-containing protein n=1 Tax=Phytophthora infestans TaxID=4787 RepID=A0A8S9U9W2_PHYIN|nr:ASPM-SPD-2-Hydin domain-containing protein [Phytophthora infestans]
MEAPVRTQMASYLERWEEQKAQSRLRRQKEQPRRSSDVGEELSFISAIERENVQQERYDAQPIDQSHQYEHEANNSFDLPAVDAFPPPDFVLPTHEQQIMPADEEFVDAASFLRKNELGGDDSFSEDVGALAESHYSGGRPSDFFESKSRNLDHVELSSPRNVDDPLFEAAKAEDEGSGMHTPKQQLSPTDPSQGVALHDRFDRDLELSGSNSSFSSGYDVHFDNAKLMYTPNSLKYLQEKSHLRSAGGRHIHHEPNQSFADYAGEAENVTRRLPSLPDQEILEDPSPEYVATLQRGPGVIEESLREIDALIDNSIRLASSPPTKEPLGVELPEDVRELVRDYERPLESMLPLSRTTDSWGEDISVTQLDDDVCRQSRELERLSGGTGPVNGVRRSRSQETPELDTIREISCPSNTDSVSRSPQSAESCTRFGIPPRPQIKHQLGSANGSANDAAQKRNVPKCIPKENHLPSKQFSGVDSKRSEGLKSRSTSATFDQSLAKVAATQNPFRDEMYRSKADSFESEEEREDDIDDASVGNEDYERDRYSRVPDNDETARDELGLESDDIDPNGVRFRYGENAQRSRNLSQKKRLIGQHRAIAGIDLRTNAAPKYPYTSERPIDVLHVTMETTMVPRRCRRFLCSVGDIMTEQIIFTNGTNAVGRICVSLLPLSTGCQQFSVSPAVLEIGPKASSAFHVTFNARYAGAVAGIFQFRGVGVESLLHPYEVVIEASVKRQLELEASGNTKKGDGIDTASGRVDELQASTSVDQVEIRPTFIRFDRVRSKSAERITTKAKLRLSNNTAQILPFKARTPENLQVRPATGMIQPASEVIVSVMPISQPVDKAGLMQRGNDKSSSNPSPRAENWFGSLKIRVGKTYMREVSVVVDRRVSRMLPPFAEIVRSRHQLSAQTDSFYYTKRGKRRGLYFHARAVEFGNCPVGESHEAPVYVCNGSNEPMTVFLQDLQEPFSCAYSTTTIEPRKFIPVMVTFTPKVVGKVATSLFAYSATDKAVVTLVARGIQ